MRGTRWMGAALAAVLALGACESTTEPVRETGDLRFTFSGDTAGSFEAVGAITRVNSQTGTFAAGSVQTLPGGRFLTVIGQRATGRTGEVDGLVVNLEAPDAGTFACTEETADCPFGLVFATGLSAAGEEETVFLSVEGSATITALDSRRVRGTFSVAMEELTFDAEPRRIQVTGSFDVPLISEWAR